MTRSSVPFESIPTTRRLFESVTAKLQEFLAQRQTRLGGPETVARNGNPLRHVYGVKELQTGDSWPRVVWVPGQDSYSGATMQAGAFGLPIKPAYTRAVGVVAYMHGRDSDMAEMMANDYAAFLHSLYGASVLMQGGSLLDGDDTQEDASWLEDGAAYRLSFAILVPVAPARDFLGLTDVNLYKCDDQRIG